MAAIPLSVDLWVHYATFATSVYSDSPQAEELIRRSNWQILPSQILNTSSSQPSCSEDCFAVDVSILDPRLSLLQYDSTVSFDLADLSGGPKVIRGVINGRRESLGKELSYLSIV